MSPFFQTLIASLNARMDRIETLAYPATWMTNETTNKQWAFRFLLVSELQKWVSGHLRREDGKKRKGRKERRAKAIQYVTGHLILGKMFFPFELVDPLFTEAEFEDESMEEQLTPGVYPEFRGMVHAQMERLRKFDPTEHPPVEWTWVSTQFASQRYKAVLQGLQNRLVYGRDKPKLGEASARVTEQMIALVLRYMCLGAFECNLHGSVSSRWAQALPRYTECFASPFNHKFETYYSMFEQDRDFGSHGNFFAMLERNKGVLPPGRYEMNPPWINAAYERIQASIEKSLDRNVEIIVVGPNWEDAAWVPKLDRAIGHPAYAEHSRKLTVTVSYDMAQTNFDMKTVVWIFTRNPVSKDLLKLLK